MPDGVFRSILNCEELGRFRGSAEDASGAPTSDSMNKSVFILLLQSRLTTAAEEHHMHRFEGDHGVELE